MCAIHTNEKLLSMNTSVINTIRPTCVVGILYTKKYNDGVYIQAIHDKPCTSFFIVVIQVLRCGVFNVVLVTNL